MLLKIYQVLAMAMFRPYARRELLGWGILYKIFVGDYRRSWAWKGIPVFWIKGKLHGYLLRIDMSSWSNRSTYFLGRYYDLQTQLALRRYLRFGDTVLDVGANEGMISLTASEIVGPTGSVMSFEPNPAPRRILHEVIAKNNIKNILVYDFGLSDTESVMPLHVPHVNTGEGTFGVSHYERGDYDVVEAKVCRGDDALGDVTPKLIKIDIEGFELYAMKGLEHTLKRSMPVVLMEVVEAHLAQAKSSSAELINYMRDLDYEGQIMELARGQLALKPLGNTLQTGDVIWLPIEKS